MWKSAFPYLKKGERKNFVIHTKGVIQAMELLLLQEKGNKDILIPAAILHDIGWYSVPVYLQKSKEAKKQKKALELHIKNAPPIIKKILKKAGYEEIKIKKIINIVTAHKFKNPKKLDKQLLIDADTLSDIFKEQFYEDYKNYKTSPEDNLNFRKNNNFYTKTAKGIFNKELKKRKEEIFKH